MGTEKLRGIVLREQAKGESNKQIVLLAQGVGRVLLSARGARRVKSKLLAATQLFCYADFVVYEGKGFYSVTQAELQNSFYGLRLDMDKFSEGMYLAELTERSCPAGMEQCKKLGGWRLHRCDLYVTLEPCPMCAGALINSRMKTVYYGAPDPKAGSCGSLINLFALPYNHQPALVSGVLEQECADILRNFFRELRKKRKEIRKLEKSRVEEQS